MNKVFLKKEEVTLLNGGYLSTKEGNPVFHAGFFEAQKHAEYIVTFAKMAKDKDFNGKPADNLLAFKAEVLDVLATKDTSYIEAPKKVKRELTEKLANEALAFMEYTEESSKVEKVNAFLQQFNVLKEFEEFGLFFGQDIVKLNKIYTIKEIVKAVESIIDLL